jgi:hypothetical protein
MIETIHCSREYHDYLNDQIKPFAVLVKAAFYSNNPPFVTQPQPEADYGTLIDTYGTALDNHIIGGAAQYGPFLIAKTALMDATDLIAKAVDDVALVTQTQ